MQVSIVQYCAKVMQVNCANFVLVLTKIRAKIRVKIRCFSSNNSLEQKGKVSSDFQYLDEYTR